MRYLLLLLLVLFPSLSHASWAVWTESLLADKVKQAYNPGTKPTSISIKSGKNEYTMFQVVARSSGESMVGFVPSVTGTFTSGANTIPDADIKFYLVNYISTVAGSAVYESAGEWPDICVPYKDRFYDETRNGTENGWGQTVAQNTSQPFLVEIYVPTATVAGTYTGTIRLTSNTGALTQDIAVTLTVWNFALPAQWSLKTSFGTEYYTADDLGTNGGSTAARMEYDYRMFQLLLDHGANLYGASGLNNVNANSTGGAPSFTHANFTGTWGFKNFLDGTASQDYFQRSLPIPNYWGIRRDDGLAGFANTDTDFLDGWGTWIQAQGYTSTTLFADKFVDEPDLSTVNSMYTAYNARHTGAGNGYPNRPYEYYTAGYATEPPKTTGFWTAAYGQMWVVTGMYPVYRPDNRSDVKADLDLVADFAARKVSYGDQVWNYYAGDNDADMMRAGYRAASSPTMDAYSRNNAWPALESYVFGAMGQHFWQVSIGWAGNTVNTVWTDTNLFNTGYNYSGDGIYIYPGWPTGSSHDIGGTHYIPLESLRLKLYRWGMQTYEYAKLLEAAGKTSTATTQLGNMITYNNLRDYYGTITIGTVAAWETAREAMGDAIAAGSAPQQSYSIGGARVKWISN